jgi:hypothetical protein
VKVTFGEVADSTDEDHIKALVDADVPEGFRLIASEVGGGGGLHDCAVRAAL